RTSVRTRASGHDGWRAVRADRGPAGDRIEPQLGQSQALVVVLPEILVVLVREDRGLLQGRVVADLQQVLADVGEGLRLLQRDRQLGVAVRAGVVRVARRHVGRALRRDRTNPDRVREGARTGGRTVAVDAGVGQREPGAVVLDAVGIRDAERAV